MTEHTETESALAAMRRAAITARERALRFGSRLVLWRDGSVVLVDLGTPGGQQDGTRQPVTRPESDSEGSDKPKPETEEHSR